MSLGRKETIYVWEKKKKKNKLCRKRVLLSFLWTHKGRSLFLKFVNFYGRPRQINHGDNVEIFNIKTFLRSIMKGCEINHLGMIRDGILYAKNLWNGIFLLCHVIWKFQPVILTTYWLAIWDANLIFSNS